MNQHKDNYIWTIVRKDNITYDITLLKKPELWSEYAEVIKSPIPEDHYFKSCILNSNDGLLSSFTNINVNDNDMVLVMLDITITEWKLWNSNISLSIDSLNTFNDFLRLFKLHKKFCTLEKFKCDIENIISKYFNTMNEYPIDLTNNFRKRLIHRSYPGSTSCISFDNLEKIDKVTNYNKSWDLIENNDEEFYNFLSDNTIDDFFKKTIINYVVKSTNAYKLMLSPKLLKLIKSLKYDDIRFTYGMIQLLHQEDNIHIETPWIPYECIVNYPPNYFSVDIIPINPKYRYCIGGLYNKKINTSQQYEKKTVEKRMKINLPMSELNDIDWNNWKLVGEVLQYMPRIYSTSNHIKNIFWSKHHPFIPNYPTFISNTADINMVYNYVIEKFIPKLKRCKWSIHRYVRVGVTKEYILQHYDENMYKYLKIIPRDIDLIKKLFKVYRNNRNKQKKLQGWNKLNFKSKYSKHLIGDSYTDLIKSYPSWASDCMGGIMLSYYLIDDPDDVVNLNDKFKNRRFILKKNNKLLLLFDESITFQIRTPSHSFDVKAMPAPWDRSIESYGCYYNGTQLMFTPKGLYKQLGHTIINPYIQPGYHPLTSILTSICRGYRVVLNQNEEIALKKWINSNNKWQLKNDSIFENPKGVTSSNKLMLFLSSGDNNMNPQIQPNNISVNGYTIRDSSGKYIPPHNH